MSFFVENKILFRKLVMVMFVISLLQHAHLETKLTATANPKPDRMGVGLPGGFDNIHSTIKHESIHAFLLSNMGYPALYYGSHRRSHF